MPEVNFDLKVCGITTGFALLERLTAAEDHTQTRIDRRARLGCNILGHLAEDATALGVACGL